MNNEILYDLPSPTRLTSNISTIQKVIKNQNSLKIQELFSVPYFQSNKLYQSNVKQIMKIFSDFDTMTDNLQSKVDKILLMQKNQFVQSYIQHMKKIQSQFKQMEQQVNRQQQLIKYYQNQGKMSNLLKKVTMLQQQSKKLYGIIQQKQKQLKTLLLQIKVQKEQNKRLTIQIKQIIKSKNQTQIKLSQIQTKSKTFNSRLNINDSIAFCQQEDHQQHHHHHRNSRFFTTETAPVIQHQLKQKQLLLAKQYGKKKGFTLNNIQKQRDLSQNKLNMNKKLSSLMLKNRKLTKFNIKILQQRSELQTLFINAVNDIKKQIIIKKKIKYCSYQDFKKQDKINLLLTIISNQQLLLWVYQKIFHNQQINKMVTQKNQKIQDILPINPSQQKNFQPNNKSNRKAISVLPYL